jgi:hypothetical protein
VRGTHRPPRRSSPKPRCSSPSRLRNNLIAARPPGTCVACSTRAEVLLARSMSYVDVTTTDLR